MEGWNEINGRCIFNSDSISEKAENWLAAKDRCKELDENSNLASIRDQADQDAFQGTESVSNKNSILYVFLNHFL